MEILDHLQFLGFREDRFLAGMKARIALGVPNFQMDYRVEIDQQEMSFRLQFQRTGIDGSYYLARYDAILWKPFEFMHGNIAGIDTAELEERMRLTDWGRIPDGRLPEDISLVERIRRICDDLQIIQSQSTDGWATSHQLRLKYWSGTPFDSLELDYLRRQFQKRKSFTAQLPDIHTCYHIHFRLWDERCRLLESLAHLGVNLETMVDRMLMTHYPEPFTLSDDQRKEEGILRLTIPLVWKHSLGGYAIDNYEAAMVAYEPIAHGIYCGIDTAALEAQMAVVDWDNEACHYTEDEEDPMFVPEIEAIISALHYELPKDPDGALVSIKLQTKYWPGSPDFSNVMETAARDYLDTRPAIKDTFPFQIHVTEAYNLLCGRAICFEWDGLWQRLDPAPENTSGHRVTDIRSYSRHELETLIGTLPIPSGEYGRVRDGLLHGDIVSVALLSGSNIKIIADPENRDLKFYDTAMEPMDASLFLPTSPRLAQEDKQQAGVELKPRTGIDKRVKHKKWKKGGP